MTSTHIGLLVMGIPALLIGGIVLGRWRPVLWMYVGAMVIGLGYLTTTGTVDEVGEKAMSYIPMTQSTPAAAPEAAPAAAPEPAAPAAAPEAATPDATAPATP
jgi:hypothetical protein